MTNCSSSHTLIDRNDFDWLQNRFYFSRQSAILQKMTAMKKCFVSRHALFAVTYRNLFFVKNLTEIDIQVGIWQILQKIHLYRRNSGPFRDENEPRLRKKEKEDPRKEKLSPLYAEIIL